MEGIVSQELQCSHCSKPMQDEQKFCKSCGFPELGSDTEKSQFHAHRVLNNSKSREAPKLIRQARNTLFVIAGLTFLFGVVIFFTQDDMATLITAAIMAIIYVLLGFWSQKKPLIALVLALLLYLTNIVLTVILEPSAIYRGIILKIIIIAFLVKGINSALHLRKAN